MTRKLIDSFIFFNELSTLKMRLHELDKIVDYFVLVEADVTHAGQPKPLHYAENRAAFEQFNHKIIHHVVDDFPEPTDSWGREFHQRNAIIGAVNRVPNIDPLDIVLVSDADEVPDPNYLQNVPFDDDTIFVFNQRFFYYDFTTENPNGWPGTMSIPYHYFANIDLNHMRKYKNRIRDARVVYTPEQISTGNHAGWHCSCFGGVDRIITKLESYSHQRYNKPKYKNKEKIAALIRNKKDLVFRWKKKYKLSANNQETDENLPVHWRLIYETFADLEPDTFTNSPLDGTG